MNMQAVDWAIVIGLLVVLLGGALSTRRYTKSVAAFLAAEESSFVTGHTYFADGGYTVAGMMEG